MGSHSEAIGLWKEKLSEIVHLAKQIKSGDRKSAVILWFASFKQIQSLWNHVLLNQQAKVDIKETDDQFKQETALTVRKKRAGQKVRVLSLRTKKQKKVAKEADIEYETNTTLKRLFEFKEFQEANRKTENETEEEFFSMQIASTNIKKETEDMETTGDESVFGNISNSGNTPTVRSTHFDEVTPKVQSVHLMISADPLLKTVTKQKKIEKSEAVDKDKNTYRCKICELHCKSYGDLQKHKEIHDNTHCAVCHQKLSSTSNLKAHMKMHFEEKLYKCSECPTNFKNKWNLLRHQNTHSREKPWSCDLCGKNYTEKSSLKVHYRTHTREKPFACSYCSKKFSQSGVLQNHLLLHTNALPHLCDICGRSFRQRSHLVTHRRRHQGIRPYSCTECESKFTTKGDYDRHLRTHTGERPYHCDVCGSSFTRLQTLQEHKNRHYKFKPYLCKTCGKSFYELSACSRHVKSVHAADTDTPPALGNIVRFSSLCSDQAEVVQQGLHVTQIIADTEDGKILEDESNAFTIENSEEMHVVNNDVDEEDRCELLVVNSDKDMEIINAAAEHIDIGNKCQNQNAEIVCDDCGAVFTTWRGLRSHSRYKSCKIRKVGKDRESGPCVSTTITARFPGVPVTQWLAEHAVSYSNQAENNMDIIESNKSTIEAPGETIESIEFIQEVEEADIGHAVSIDEDGSITTLPFSQLAPIHIKLENEYMVVLSDSTKVQEEATEFATCDIQQVEIDHHTHNIKEENEQRITLVLDP